MGTSGRRLLLTTMAAAAAGGGRAEGRRGAGERITPADIEAQLRSITGAAAATVTKSTRTTVGAGIAAGAAVVALTYLYGRRRGKNRATVLEIRRV